MQKLFSSSKADSGVELDGRGNVVVDENLETNVEGVFAAGDVASFPLRLPIFDDGESRVSIGHWQLALAHGKCAGLNVAAKEKTQIKTVPFFWTVQVSALFARPNSFILGLSKRSLIVQPRKTCFLTLKISQLIGFLLSFATLVVGRLKRGPKKKVFFQSLYPS